MIDYDYEDITEQPNIATYERDAEGNLVLVSGIQYDVANSDMTNKTIECGTWWNDTSILRLVFTNSLSTGDKAILDDIVEANS